MEASRLVGASRLVDASRLVEERQLHSWQLVLEERQLVLEERQLAVPVLDVAAEIARARRAAPAWQRGNFPAWRGRTAAADRPSGPAPARRRTSPRWHAVSWLGRLGLAEPARGRASRAPHSGTLSASAAAYPTMSRAQRGPWRGRRCAAQCKVAGDQRGEQPHARARVPEAAKKVVCTCAPGRVQGGVRIDDRGRS